MDLALAGKRVLVTGGTRGIGRETVLAFARAGARVVACHRSPGEDADGLARELKALGDGHRVVRADVTDAAEVAALAQACREALGGLDVVVNNVGIDARSPLHELTAAEFRRVLETNLTCGFTVIQAALPLLADGGSIVNIGAVAGYRGRPESAHYGASKTALTGLTRSLAKEVGKRGIRVNIVAPGVIVTEPGGGPPPPVADIIRGMTALGDLGRGEDVAAAVLFLASDVSRYVTGATVNVDGGI
ncbi:MULTISPECIES: SDR family NAD(P)-dependent oxidoreductase [Actinomadura]|uniref:SDR family NAD(P)-dependent oxidoreductase n=1 Tax=Actinomadura yumaensis TaxID=111807 RepID=A0ABW2CQU0_9ACTN|nr:SDR family NAD(P)-dependent oxidoreductase [Actinomadura sp. J1-007]MWK36720.1 SDR family oxidoreductase [Actinomadura sp. J1-007]